MTQRPMWEWDHNEIRDYYDLNPDLSILTYAGMLGLSGGELKEILMTDGNVYDKQEAETAEQMFDPFYQESDLGEWWSR